MRVRGEVDYNQRGRASLVEASMRKLSILAAALAVSAMLPGVAAAITCYTVLDRSDATIYQDTQPPMDLSSEGGAAARATLRARNEFLTISDADRCPVIAAPVGATGYQPATVDEIVAGIREYAKAAPGTVTSGKGGARGAPAAPARSSTPARKY
jgi:hypothetical protein